MRPINGSMKYAALHQRIYRKWGKANHCDNNSNHHTTRYEWASISGRYIFDRNDWKQLCPSCHRKMDFTEETRVKMSRARRGKDSKRKKTVAQLNRYSGKVIKIFDSITSAALSIKRDRSTIHSCLSGSRPTAGGYKWKYN
jgi:hypothetical protein